MYEKIIKAAGPTFYTVFRIIVGLLFALVGAKKVFGAFGGTAVDLTSLMGAAGLIELIGGILILVGLFTRTTAVITAIEMAYAFIVAHVVSSGSLNPLVNGGERSLLYFAAFLVIFINGAGDFSIDSLLNKKK